MATLSQSIEPPALGPEKYSLPQLTYRWLATVDHKKLGLMYIIAMLLFFVVSGCMAILIRIQLALPNNHFVTPETFNRLLLYSSYATGSVPDIGWFGYAPLTNSTFSHGAGTDFWVLGVLLAGFGSISSAINVVATTIAMRCPGMTLRRMPMFVWVMLVDAALVLILANHIGDLDVLSEAIALAKRRMLDASQQQQQQQ